MRKRFKIMAFTALLGLIFISTAASQVGIQIGQMGERPHIIAVEPESAAPGTTIMIIGSGFSEELEENIVRFGTGVTIIIGGIRIGEAQARVLAATERSLAVVVPELPDGEAFITVERCWEECREVCLPGKEKCWTECEKRCEGGSIRFIVDHDQVDRELTPEDIEAGFVIGEVIIFFKPQVTPEDIEAIRKEYGFAWFQGFPLLGFSQGRLAEETVENTLRTVEMLNRDPRVEEAFPNFLTDTSQLNDPYFPRQTYLMLMNLPEGWETFFPRKGEGTIIALVDTGMDLNMGFELPTPKRAPMGLNFSPGNQKDPVAIDELGHGTPVAAIAGAQGNNAFQGTGIAFRARLLPLKVFSKGPFGLPKGTLEGVARAISAATLVMVDVVNLSLGCAACNEEKEQEQRRFYRRILRKLEFLKLVVPELAVLKLPILVAATGNQGQEIVDSPAADPKVIAVGSITLEGSQWKRSSFSNYGPEVDFVAKGEGIWTTMLGGEFGKISPGTSFAAPQVAGLVSLILAEGKGLSLEGVKERIIRCFVEDLGASGKDDETGYGRIYIPNPAKVDPSCRPRR